MSNHSVIEHRANYHYIKVEEDLIAICIGEKANPHCKATILAILEGWTNTKRDKGEDPSIYMTYPQWIRATYWLYGRNVIIEALEELVADGFIGRRDHRMHGKDTFIYTLNVKAVQEKIRQLPEKAQDDYLPSFNLNAFKNKRVPNQTRPKSNGKKEKGVYYQTGDAFNKGRNIESITNLQEDITSNESNSDDTTKLPVVSSDTARAFSSSGEIDEVMIRGVIAQSSLSSEGEITEEFIQRTIDAFKQSVLVELRARPGLSEHPDDQLPSQQNEQVFTNDEPQGDTYAAAASGHPHRVGEPAPSDMGHSHRSGHSARLEAKQEIDKGEHHANRVPPLSAANTPASSERAPSRHDTDHSHSPSVLADGLPVVRPVGSSTPGQKAGRDGRDAAHTLEQTPPTPTPAQSLSPSPQAEQAALGQGKGKGKKQAEPKPETPKSPPIAPPADMAWGTRKCLMWFDFWRGGILIGKFKLMQASTCAKGLAEQFDEQTVIQARTDMEADPYYAAKGGCDVCDVANNIHKYLKRRQGKQQTAQSVASSVLGASGLPRWTSTGMPLQVVSASARRR